MYNNRVIPGANPGEIYIEGIGVQRLSDWQDTHVWDTEIIPAGVIPAGAVYRFFASQQFTATGAQKTILDTNMTQQQQNPKGWVMVINGIHFKVRPGTLFDDAQLIFGGSSVRFITGNDKTEREGQMEMFPSIYGLTGMLSNDGNVVAIEKSNLNNGTPALGAIGKPMPITIGDMMTYRAEVTIPYSITLVAAVFLEAYLRVYMQKPVR